MKLHGITIVHVQDAVLILAGTIEVFYIKIKSQIQKSRRD